MEWRERTEDIAILQEGLPHHPELVVSLDHHTVIVETPRRPIGTWGYREFSTLFSLVVLLLAIVFWVIFMIWSSWIMVALALIYVGFAYAFGRRLAQLAFYRHRLTFSPKQLIAEELLFERTVSKISGGPDSSSKPRSVEEPAR